MKGNVMRRIPLLLIAGAVVGVAALCLGAASPDPSPDSPEIEQLRKEIAALRLRVELLEERLKDRAIVVPRGDGRQGPGLIEPRGWPRQAPRDWKPFEFNGMQFYVIPTRADIAAGRDAVLEKAVALLREQSN
jgi:hypothetical protein